MTTQTLREHASSFVGDVGLARVDITPPVGIYARNWGAAAGDCCTGIHQPLTLTVIALRQRTGGEPLILGCIDLGGGGVLGSFGRPDNALVKALCAGSGVALPRVLLAFSHTHAGPRWCDKEDLPGMELIPAYFESLRELSETCARQAVADLQPGRLDWAWGVCDLARNRDMPDPAGSRYLTGYNLDAAADDTLLVGRISGEDGQVRAVLVNYACHPTTLAWGNSLISPDYVGSLRATVEAAYPGSLCGFLQGASGELQPRNAYAADVAEAERNGRSLGHSVLATLEQMRPPGEAWAYQSCRESGAPLGVWGPAPEPDETSLQVASCEISLALKPGLATVAQLQERRAAASDRAMIERIDRATRLRRAIGDGNRFTVPIWAWRIGGALLIAQINECYSAYQQQLRADLPGRHLAVCNLVNGSLGYLPPDALYDEDLYTVWQTVFDRGSLERCTDASRELLATVQAAEPAQKQQA